ncbi:MAG: tRNA (5-methylaminomethyl-2-thiouridine)(34)-methyltransferase MnmD [bacterium]|nr:tRNA (5-methylaminomethyl-2-thiouridine)(34)-methyltransferase MnmD [bacterium]
MKREITKTADGSTTIYIPEMDENYHSHHGAIQEARHVFIQNGIGSLEREEVTVFEMGFGTGLNALLTLEYALEHDKRINYFGIEAYPVEMELVDNLNYLDEVGEKYTEQFQTMHNAPWGTPVEFSNFQLTKIHQKVEDFEPKEKSVDVIYFDAFGPRAQGDMWELPVLEKMARMIKPDGILVTYCAQGQFKRHLKSLGFTIERLPGPPGKREMTRGTKVV